MPAAIKDIQATLQEDSDHPRESAARESAAREIVLTGVHLGSWGKDLPGSVRLHHLVQAILAETEVARLRLSSLEPWDLEPNFFTLWENPRLCRHLHLPLQSGSAATLRRMARKTTPHAFEQLVQAARQAIPGVAITTDIITGFPGESEAEFAECLAFVRQMGFAGGHVFTYSPRPGTAAASMPGQVPESLRKEQRRPPARRSGWDSALLPGNLPGSGDARAMGERPRGRSARLANERIDRQLFESECLFAAPFVEPGDACPAYRAWRAWLFRRIGLMLSGSAMNAVLSEFQYPSSQRLQIVQGDITREEVDAIVNAANARLQHGGGSCLGDCQARRSSDSGGEHCLGA